MRRRWKVGIVVVVIALGALTSLFAAVGGAKKSSSQGAAWGVYAGMSGKQEISATTGKKRAGDPDGFGVFAATVQGTKLCFGITVGGIADPAAAHIHAAKRNKNGAIVVPLTPVPATGSPGASSGCVDVDAALLAAIHKHPDRYYANVHTADFPNGAIRGQLRKAKAK
jgi:hypothetical protein